MRALAAAVLLLATPAAADDTIVNAAQVRACLSEQTATPEDCLDVVLQPCAHHGEAGIARACYARLRYRWEAVIRESTGSLPERQPADPACVDAMMARLGTGAEVIHAVRNACRLFATVALHHNRKTAAMGGPDADLESLEACVLETAAAGHEESCIGIFAGDCNSAATSSETCLQHEIQLWLKVLRANWSKSCPECSPRQRNQEMMLRMLNAKAECQRKGTNITLCRRDAIARAAIDALLDAEAQ